RSTAILSEAGKTQRDDHLRSIEQHGRLGWQRRSGYGRRSLVEAAMYRYKTIIGRRLHARTLPNQQIEAKIGCNALNRMTSLGMPVSIRVK
ncbi:MAG: Transposase of ISAli17, family, subgroup, partial [Rhodopila sp.]|nr:Transposase of ISAli17, family, subgroup [Rhodopila sp.]